MEEDSDDDLSVLYEDVEGLTADFEKLLVGANSDVLSDVVLEGEDGTSIEAHSLLLRSRSEYLNVALGGNWREWNVNATVPGLMSKPVASTSALHAVVRYIYTGEVGFSDKNVYEILNLAREMLLDDLVQLGYVYIRSSLKPESAVFHAGEILASCDQNLLQLLCEFVAKAGQEILITNEFTHCSRYELTAILQHENVGVHEDVVLKAVQIWAEVSAGFDRELAFDLVCQLLSEDLVRCLSLSVEAFTSIEDLGLVPSEKRHLRRMYIASRTEGYRYMIPTSTFRQSLRGAVAHLESSHPLTGEFRAEVQLTQDTDAIYIEVDSRSELSPELDLVWYSLRSGSVLQRLSDFNYARSKKTFMVSGHRIGVKLVHKSRRPAVSCPPPPKPCWGFLIKSYSVINGKRWRRRNHATDFWRR
ncbi:hypothetical protein NDN08_002729 [Rhodosorus marinus]|uniref:BTB domain-containing protein n=1 Tax=Rhodosorus marinus TaxID=101924 RepID=A0AAV8UUK6_9RHOD|nr:hypothetical protein NDN08_002729 [Rhodosorus marinus]